MADSAGGDSPPPPKVPSWKKYYETHKEAKQKYGRDYYHRRKADGSKKDEPMLECPHCSKSYKRTYYPTHVIMVHKRHEL